MPWLFAALWFTGCTGTPSTDDPSDTDSNTPVVVAEPEVHILAPADGTVITSADLEVIIEVIDFDFTTIDATKPLPAMSAPLPLWLGFIASAEAHEPGESPNGYAELRVDGVVTTQLLETTAVVSGLSTGKHVLEVELYYPDGDAYYPPATATANFTVALPDTGTDTGTDTSK